MPCRATGEVSGSGQETKAGMKRKPGPEPLLYFWWAGQGRVNSLGLAGLNSSGGLWL